MVVLDSVINIVLLLFILVVLVVVHEFGHFIAARRAGVTVHEFGIGFPPRAKVLARDHETVYTLNWLPLGGFVRLEAEEGQSLDPRAFVRQRLPVKLVILLAGVAMNFLLAWLIFSVIPALGDPTIGVRVGGVEEGSPAALAGLRGGKEMGTIGEGGPCGPITDYDASGDLILAVNGQRFPSFDDITDLSVPLKYIRSQAGKPVTLTVRGSDGAVRDVSMTARPESQIDQCHGATGFSARSFEPGDSVRRDLGSSVAIGFDRTVDASLLVLRELRNLVSNLTSPSVSGPIGIVSAVATARTELPPIFMLWLVGLLSANLAVVNVLPIPPMDGGRIAVALAQAITGNRVSVALERAVYLAGFVFLMIFLVWISYFDIQRQFGGT
jgi:regulator of sigma E protease